MVLRSPGPDSQAALDERSGEIFRRIVESYLESGEPLGSRNLSRILPMSLSPASVRNVMSDLEELGLIYSPHTSAGRLPTQLGLRFFVDAFMQIGNISAEDRASIERHVRPHGPRDRRSDQAQPDDRDTGEGQHYPACSTSRRRIAMLWS